ncbi:hypothetical protein JAAARDRAFT_295435 [Jaapia argillacea MUCL 33604]|uniref:Uncharacterized protein n=1 Tax=Jaapia argillacea MUCL 33604 TaxID=933084 RepID=A0A067PP68_9AGAM|nr:hypothetical protein JAAARDRAFT_295435 [Jaapia argillacea MUCL 33604]
MFFKLSALLPFFILSSLAVATPVEPRDFVLTEADVPGTATKVIPGDSIIGSRSVNTGLHEFDTRANPYLLLCDNSNCSANCYSFTLTDRTPYNCYSGIGTFVSVKIQDPNPGGLPYAVYVGSSCSSPPDVAIPAVNTCYNLSPGGTNWFIT